MRLLYETHGITSTGQTLFDQCRDNVNSLPPPYNDRGSSRIDIVSALLQTIERSMSYGVDGRNPSVVRDVFMLLLPGMTNLFCYCLTNGISNH